MSQEIDSMKKHEITAHVKAAILHAEKGEFFEAITLLTRLHEQFPENKEVALYLGALSRMQNDMVASTEYIRNIYMLSPEDFDAFHGLVINALITRDRKLAVELLHEAENGKKLSHAEDMLLIDRASLTFLLGYPLQAISILEDGRRRFPQNASIAQNLAQLYSAVGDTVSAKRLQGVLTETENVSHTGSPGETVTSFSFSTGDYAIAPMRIFHMHEARGYEGDIALSIVVPIMNEEENISILYNEITDVLATLKQSYEIIFIDDGSTDGSRQVERGIAYVDPRVKIVLFRRNYGQTAAMSAGFKLSRGAVVITMDGDLQNDPKDIPALLEKMSEGYDLVSGWRKNRQDTLITRKIPSRIANKIINHLISGTGVQLHDFGCTLKAYKSEIVKNIHIYGEMHRFIPVFAAWLGVRVTELAVNHRPRVHGYAKYNLSRVQRVIFDLIVVRFFSSYSTRPIHFFGRIAKLAFQLGLLALLVLGLISWTGLLSLRADTFFILGSILCLGCLQILIMGLTGELLIRSYFELQKKDHYVVERIINE